MHCVDERAIALQDRELKPAQIAVAILLISVMTMLLSVALQPGAFTTSIGSLIERPLALLLNWLPIALTIVLGYFVLGNPFWGSAAPSLIWLILSYANLLKIEGRDDALVPADIALIREALTAASSYNLDLHLPLLLSVVAYIAVLTALGFFIKAPKLRFVVRLALSGIMLALLALSLTFVYPNKDIYNNFSVPSRYNIPSVFNTLGFNYCFLYNLNLYPVDKPEGYNKTEVEEWIDEYANSAVNDNEASDATTAPNVIMVMGEAFSDLSNEDVFCWESENENPIYKYNLLTKSDRAISGHIVVSNISAGTANTEFDILTGMPTNMISDATTSSFRVINRSTPTIASALSTTCYSTAFLHPGNSWFYNRSSVYRHFGIEDQTFINDFEHKSTIADGLITDEAFLEQLKDEIEGNQSPQFIYSVSIQNHQAYTYKKYADETAPAPVSAELSDKAMEYLSVYLRGAEDTSEMVYELAKYIDTLSEPTVLVFFGDHLPNLGENNLAYSELGLSVGNTDTPTNTLSAYETPYLIYGNTAYCATTDFQSDVKALELPSNNLINSNYLGAMVLELIGQTELDPYFDFLNEARRVLPVFRERENVYMAGDGTISSEISNELYSNVIKKIDWWEYYRLRG